MVGGILIKSRESRLKWFCGHAPQHDLLLIKNLPNLDYKIFKEITGIDLKDFI